MNRDPADVGTTSRIRAQVEYTEGAGPSQVFVKIQGSRRHRIGLLALGLLYNEARILQYELPIEAPSIFATGVDRRHLQSVIVMEDLQLRGAKANEAIRPLSPDQVATGIDGLAGLHARFWGLATAEADGLGWLVPWRFTLGWRMVAHAGLRDGFRRDAETLRRILPRSVASRGDLVRLWKSHESSNTGPVTVLHGDTHVGNTYTCADGTVGFLDWQVACSGSWAHDVGYFMISALTVEDRRAHERGLLDRYRLALVSAGVDAPTADEIWWRYRRSPAYGLPVWASTFGFGGGDEYQKDDNSVATLERFAAAFEEHDTEEAMRRSG